MKNLTIPLTLLFLIIAQSIFSTDITWTDKVANDPVTVEDYAEIKAAVNSKSDIDGDVYTGTHDFGGADDLEIPNGAAPTVDTDGQIAHDTTADQLIVGADPTVFDKRFEQCVVFENLAAADDNYEIWEFQRGVTITYVSAHCRGTCTTEAEIGFEDRGGNAFTLASTLTASSGTGNSTPIAVSSGGTLVAGEGMAIDVDNAVNPETDEYTICFMGTVTRE